MEEEEAELIVGTYEDYVIGYRIETVEKPTKRRRNSSDETATSNGKTSSLISLEQSFAVRGHSGSVLNVAINGNGTIAISSGFDEMVNVFNLKKRKLLQTFEGAFKCAVFVENSHLICGSEDTHIYIYELKKSEMILAKTLRGHKEPITSLSVHPSGKILLSLSKDNTMRTWNLIKGRVAFVTQVKPQAHLVEWSLDGSGFVIAANNEVYLYNNSGELKHNIKSEKRINSVEFITNNIFLVANDSGELEFIDLTEGKSLMKFEAHETRIKSVRRVGSNKSDVVRFATASSDGKIKLWECDAPDKSKPTELALVDTGARLTCMTSATRKLDAP